MLLRVISGLVNLVEIIIFMQIGEGGLGEVEFITNVQYKCL